MGSLCCIWFGCTHELIGNLGKELIIRSTANSDSMRYAGIADGHFSLDGRYVAIRSVKDSLIVMNMQTRQVSIYGKVKSFQWAPRADRDVIAWIGTSGDLRMMDMGTGLDASIKRVKAFGYGVRGKALFAVQESDSINGGHNELHLVNLDEGQDKVVWRGGDIGKILCSEDLGELVFFGAKEKGQGYTIWRYPFGAEEALSWISNCRDQNGDSIVPQQSAWGLLPGKGGIYFYVKMASQPGTEAKAPGTNVRIWRYDDEFEGSNELPVPPEGPLEDFLAVAYPGSSKVVTINNATDSRGQMRIDENPDYPFALEMSRVNIGEGYRLPGERPDIYLVDLRNGTRRRVAREIQNAEPNFSGKGRYVYWFNAQDHNFYTYNIKTGKTVVASGSVKFPLYDETLDQGQILYYPYGAVNWDEDDGRMLVNDRYDIWALDPDGQRAPVNLSGGYGRAKKIRLRFSYLLINFHKSTTMMSLGKDTALLCGFNERTMGNGFFKLNLHGNGRIEQLVMGNTIYYYSEHSFNVQEELKKAVGSDTYLLKGMGVGAYPNLCVTSDFRRFSPMSALEPQRKYNWLTDSLLHWKTFSGKAGAGILYKPEDFDPNKKYPVIFCFYERLSTHLNLYLGPEFSRGEINIPWFTSRGYLVFCPDIWYQVGNPGAGVYDYVLSAAKYLAKKTWVDSTRMGINGHSWGGFEVNYLITRSKFFAAAVSGSGLANLTSEYGLEGFSCCSGPANAENSQNRMGNDLCTGLKNYLDNSPVFKSDKVATPLLMMANPKDMNVPWEQGVEFFTVLRRLGKRVWMLEYPDAAHTVSGANAQDYTTRLTDFFDYYLKGGEMPGWMKQERSRN